MLAVEGEIAFRKGCLEEAIPSLISEERAMFPDQGENLLVSQTLARAYMELGRIDEAITVLERATSAPRGCGSFGRTVFWPHARYDLMELYRMRDQHREADAIRAELLKLLARADDDFPLKVRLLESGSRPIESRLGRKSLGVR